MVTECVQSLKFAGGGTIPGVDEVSLVWSETGSYFNDGGGNTIGQTVEPGVVFHDRVHGGATSDYEGTNQKTLKTASLSDTYRYKFRSVGVGEDLALAPVNQISDPVDVRRRETIGVSLVVGQVSVDVGVVMDHASRPLAIVAAQFL